MIFAQKSRVRNRFDRGIGRSLRASRRCEVILILLILLLTVAGPGHRSIEYRIGYGHHLFGLLLPGVLTGFFN